MNMTTRFIESLTMTVEEAEDMTFILKGAIEDRFMPDDMDLDGPEYLELDGRRQRLLQWLQRHIQLARARERRRPLPRR
jgi:hypothetical protein